MMFSTTLASAVGLAIVAAPAVMAQNVALYGQCGGTGYSGSKTCAPGGQCVAQNSYYSQCIPGSAQPAPAPTTQASITTSKAPVTSSKASATTSKASVSTSSQSSAPTSPASLNKSGIYALGAVKTAIATTYGGNAWDGGKCSFTGYSPSGLVGVAMGKQQWFNTAACGACVEITGATGSVVAMANNQCPECVDNHLDLETGYAAQVDKDFGTKGIFDISWKFVPCPVTGNMQYLNKGGSSAYYFALQVRNSKVPIDTLEVSTNGGSSWTAVNREDYNFFTQYSGFGSKVDIRITSTTGEVIVEKGIPVTDGGIVQGTQQFKA